MRRDNVNGDDRLLLRDNIDDRLKDSIITPEQLEALVAKAKEMRSQASAELLQRFGEAMVNPFRRWTRTYAVRAHTGVDRTGPAEL